MSSSAIVTPAKWSRPFTKTAEIYWKETKYEFLKRWRMPVYSLSVVLFPAMFYTLFGLILNKDLSGGHKEAATYLLATMAATASLAWPSSASAWAWLRSAARDGWR